MLPYFIVFSCCLFLNSISSKKNIIPIFISCLLLSILAGVRDINIGTDTNLYPSQYLKVAKSLASVSEIATMESDEHLDKGFVFLYYIGYWVSRNIWIGLFLTEFVITFFTFWGYLRLSKYIKGLSLFTACFLFLIFNYSLNAMRQECAISISFLAFTYLWEKRWKSYVFWMFIAYTFHSSALIALLLPIMLYIVNIRSEKMRIISIIILLACILFSFFSYYYLISMIGDSGIVNEKFVNRYGEDSYYEGLGRVGWVAMILSLFIIYVIHIAKNKKLMSNKVLLFHLLVNIIYLAFQAFAIYSIFMYRISLYFFIIDLFFLSKELASVKIKREIKMIFVLFLLVNWIYTYTIKNSSETYPYTSEILGIR